MNKKYIVHLTDEERETLGIVMKKLKRSSQKVQRAQILFKADAEGPPGPTKKTPRPFHELVASFTSRRTASQLGHGEMW